MGEGVLVDLVGEALEEFWPREIEVDLSHGPHGSSMTVESSPNITPAALRDWVRKWVETEGTVEYVVVGADHKIEWGQKVNFVGATHLLIELVERR